MSRNSYASEHNLTTPGPDRLIATGNRRRLNHAARHLPADTPHPPTPPPGSA